MAQLNEPLKIKNSNNTIMKYLLMPSILNYI